MIKISNLSKKYTNGDTEISVLKNISFSISTPGMYFLLGKSGSGKSTLLNILGGIIGDYSGDVNLLGVNVGELTEKEWDLFRGSNIGLVFQDYSLLEEKRVIDNILLPTWISKTNNDENQKKSKEVLQAVRLSGFEEKIVNKLSGGEKQRVAIARAIINSPSILLADEPTGNLDSFNASEIFKVLSDISKNCIVIIVSHDSESAYKYGDSVYHIKDGNVTEGTVSKESFTVQVTGNELSEISQYVNKSELIEGIGNIICEINWEVNRQMSFSVKSEKVSTQKKAIQTAQRQTELQKKPLDLSRAFELAKENFFLNRIKNTVGLFLLVVMMVLIFILWNCSVFDGGHSLWSFYKGNKMNYMVLSSYFHYTNSFYDECEAEITSGEFFYDQLTEIFGENNIYSYVDDVQLMISKNRSESIRAVFLKDQDYPYTVSCGCYPQKANEIALTDYLCTILGIDDGDLGCDLTINQQQFQLCGIISTDYKEYGIKNQINSKQVTEYGEYKLINEYLVAFANTGYATEVCESIDNLGLNGSSILYTEKEQRYLNSYMEYGACVEENNVVLEAGRLPDKDNEIIVSLDVAEEMKLLDEGFCDFKGNYIDIHNEKYNHVYSNWLNMSEFFPEGFTIVGVFTSADFDEIVPDALLYKSVFERIKEEYFDYYWKTGYYVIDKKISEYEMDKVVKEGFKWDSPNALRIHMFIDILEYISKYVVIILILSNFGLMAICSLIIGQSIKDRARMLGVMRAVGYLHSDLRKIFYIESLGIGIIGVIGSVLSTCLICSWINYDYASKYIEYRFDIITFSPINIIIPAFICMMLCLISSAKPIRRLSNKKPFELLHCNTDTL